MSRYDSRPSAEGILARLHIIRIIENLGQQATGTYIVAVPGHATDAENWLLPALAYFRELRDATGVVEDPFDKDNAKAAYDAALLTAEGIYSGHTGARCMLFLTEDSHDDLRHPSVRLADGIIFVEIDAELVVQAAKELGRVISAAEAKLLMEMPSRHRRFALLSPRPISESHALHLIALEAEAAAKVVEDLKAAKKDKTPKRNVPEVRPLEELHGYGDAKSWGLELARDVEDWRRGGIGWSDVDNGVLLSGPPGTGKTTFAAALAKTLDAHLVVGSYSAWLGTGDGHQGNLIGAMRAAFDAARTEAPSVLLIDEIDNFVQRGSIGDGRADEWMRGVVNALLECMDGALDREGVIVVGATNDPSGLDGALRRAGRLDRHIAIGLPDREARLSILAQHLGVDSDPGFGLKAFVRHTEGMSGADLERLARDARRLARRDGTALKHVHVCRAFPKRVKRTADELRHIAVHEVGHAVVAAALGATVHEVVVRKDRGPNVEADVAGHAAVEARPGRRDYQWYADRVAQILGGMAVEQMIFGTHADGIVVDLNEATNVMTYALVTLGMGGTLISDGHRDPTALAADRQVDPVLRRRVDEALQEQAARARDILERNRGAVEKLVEVLILRGHIDGDVVTEALRTHAPVQLSLAV